MRVTSVHFANGSGVLELNLSLSRQAGITAIRDGLRWQFPESKPGEYAVPDRFDALVNRAVEAGMQPLPFWAAMCRSLKTARTARRPPRRWKVWPDTASSWSAISRARCGYTKSGTSGLRPAAGLERSAGSGRPSDSESDDRASWRDAWLVVGDLSKVMVAGVQRREFAEVTRPLKRSGGEQR